MMKTLMMNSVKSIGPVCLCLATVAHADTAKLEDLMA
jgi:hypothetical protein